MEDALASFPGDPDFDIVKAKLASMFKNSKWDVNETRNEKVDHTNINTHNLVRPSDKPSSSSTPLGSLALVDVTPIQQQPSYVPGAFSPLSQFWSSPTLHAECDRLSNQKHVAEENDQGLSCKKTVRDANVPSISKLEKGKQIAVDLNFDKEGINGPNKLRSCLRLSGGHGSNNDGVGVSEVDKSNDKRMVTFADFPLPPLILGLARRKKRKTGVNKRQ